MDELIPPESRIDNEITTIRAQSKLHPSAANIAANKRTVDALRHRRALLSHTLLSSRRVRQRLERAKSTSPTLRTSIDSALDRAESCASNSLSNSYRICSGITAFRVRDPDPNAIDNGDVLGVRIDVFSATKRQFMTPYYLLLNRPGHGSEALKVHKHTIPPFVPLQQLAAKHLPAPAGDADEEEVSQTGQPQNLLRFVRALRRDLVAHHKRLEACEALTKELGRKHGVDGVKMLDITGCEVEIVFTDGSIARMKVSTEGTIANVAVVPGRTADSEEVPAGPARSLRQLKKVIEGRDGRIEGLVDRLKTRPRG